MVLTSNGPIKDVNFPDKANNPKPDAWLFWSIDLVMKTLLADWIGPIKKPFIAAKIKKSSCVLIKRIIVDENIKPNKEKIMTDLDVNLSLAYPPIIAPIKAVIFISIDKTSKSLISNLNTPTANIPPITIIAFKPSA